MECTPIETFPETHERTNERKSINQMPFALGCLTKWMWNFARMNKNVNNFLFHLHPFAMCVCARTHSILNGVMSPNNSNKAMNVWILLLFFRGLHQYMSKSVNTHVSEWTNRPNGSNRPIVHTHTHTIAEILLFLSLAYSECVCVCEKVKIQHANWK